MTHKVAPSLLSADFANLKQDIEMINNSEADWFHCDIMDGVFVPNISFGFPILNSIKKYVKKPLDVHLMIVEPDKFITQFKEVGAYMFNVHYEVCNHLHRTIQNIKSHDMKAGITLNPHTPVNVLEDIINEVDMVLLMSVNPGFGGQKFIKNTYNKIKMLRELIQRKNSSALIEVDGGVDSGNYKQLIDAGVDIMVVGSYIFNSENPTKTISGLKK